MPQPVTRAILYALSKTCSRASRLQRGNTCEESPDYAESMDCQKLLLVYSFSCSWRPRLSRPARFETQGRTCRSAAIGTLATFPSDAGLATHSQNGGGCSVSKFLRRSADLFGASKRRDTHQPTAGAGTGNAAQANGLTRAD